MIVMKFGGTSVGSAERIRGVAERVRERLAQSPLVVVSALGGITDLLLRGARMALARDPGAEELRLRILQRHLEVIQELFPAGPVRERLRRHIEGIGLELDTLYKGVHFLEELTPRSLDAIAGMGERLSFEIVAAALDAQGVPAIGIDARAVIVTDDSFGRALPLKDETAARVRDTVRPLLGARVPVLGGFVGATRAGVATTLGRGG